MKDSITYPNNLTQMGDLTDAGTPFPERDLIIFLAFCVILATLVGQGLTLPPLINKLKFPIDSSEKVEELLARRESAKAALAKIDEFATEHWIAEDVADSLRVNFQRMLERAQPHDAERDSDAPERGNEMPELFAQILDAQRQAVRTLHQQGEISETVRRKVERTLDLQESTRIR